MKLIWNLNTNSQQVLIFFPLLHLPHFNFQLKD